MGSLWNRSGMVERYADDLRAGGAQAFFFNGGTTTPMVVFRDSGESSAHPNPVVADANGRWPDVFVPYIVSFDVQVKTADNVQLTYSLQIPNPDPVSLSVTIAPEEKVQTGMIHSELVNGTRSGYVRLNGRTIGNGSSSGTERANDDTLALFTYLWSNLTDAIAPVFGGRGGSAAADFSPGNKTITLPSWQGVGPVGLDDMGAAAGNFFTGLTFAAGNATTPGSLTGANGVALDITNMPAHTHGGSTSSDGFVLTNKATGIQSVNHTHSGTTGAGSAHQHSAFIGDDGHTHSYNSVNSNNAGAPGSGTTSNVGSTGTGSTTGSSLTGVKVRSTAGTAATADNQTATESAHTHAFTSGNQSVDHTHNFSITAVESSHSHTFTTDSKGSGVAFNNLGRSRLVTWFIKL